MNPTSILKRWSTDQLITGIEADRWAKLLVQNDWRVAPTYFHRAAWVTGWSLPATVLGRIEQARYGREVAATPLDPTPLFVLGHWRSGTTHLHNLLGRAPGNTYPTVYQVVFPTAFLLTEQILPRLTGGLLSETRTYDNVKQGWYEAAEDEIALAKLTGLSPYVAFMFPENATRYEKYVDFLEVGTAERDTWAEALRTFLKKIMFQTGGKRVIVKSCAHTARVRLLLEMFPDARFVHIHRHPYEVFASTMHMRSHTDWENFFHLPDGDPEGVRRRETLQLGRRIFERIAEDRHIIPEGQLLELAYEDLVGHELDVLANLYETLGLPGWDAAEPVIRGYVDGIGDYKRNELDITPRIADEVWDHWRVAFDTYGYSREYQA